jgi:hypothetical protein
VRSYPNINYRAGRHPQAKSRTDLYYKSDILSCLLRLVVVIPPIRSSQQPCLMRATILNTPNLGECCNLLPGNYYKQSARTAGSSKRTGQTCAGGQDWAPKRAKCSRHKAHSPYPLLLICQGFHYLAGLRSVVSHSDLMQIRVKILLIELIERMSGMLRKD